MQAPLAGVVFGLLFNLCGNEGLVANCKYKDTKIAVSASTISKLVSSPSVTWKDVDASLPAEVLSSKLTVLCPTKNSEVLTVVTEYLARENRSFSMSSWKCDQFLDTQTIYGYVTEQANLIALSSLVSLPSGLNVASLKNGSLGPVDFSLDAVMKCATPQTLMAGGVGYSLQEGDLGKGCYNFAESYSIMTQLKYQNDLKLNLSCDGNDPVITMQEYLGWIYGHPLATGYIAGLNYNSSLTGQGLAPIAFADIQTSHQLVQAIACDGYSLLNPSSLKPNSTAYVLLAAVLFVAALLLGSILYAVRSGKVDINKVLAAVFAEVT
eukprot:763409-Hanusia_phi.AAC.4